MHRIGAVASGRERPPVAVPVFLALAVFSDGLFFGGYGAVGATYVGSDDTTYRLFKAAFGLIAIALCVNSAFGALARRRRASTADMIFGWVLAAVAVSVAVGVVRYPGTEWMHRFATLFVTLSVPMALLAFSVRVEHIVRAVRPLLVVSTCVTVLMLMARLRGQTEVDLNGSTATYFSGVGGASHLVVGAAMSYAFVVHLLALLHARSLLARALHTSVVIAAVYLIVDSGSRGALFAIFVGSLVVVIVGGGLSRRPLVSLALVVAAGIGWSYLTAVPTQSFGTQKIQGIFSEDGDLVGDRAHFFETAWQMFLGSPVVGNGVGSFSSRFGEFVYPHNLVLDLMVDYGIFGLAAALLGGVWLVKVVRSVLVTGGTGEQFVAGIAVVVVSGMLFSGSYLTQGNLWLLLGILRLVVPGSRLDRAENVSPPRMADHARTMKMGQVS